MVGFTQVGGNKYSKVLVIEETFKPARQKIEVLEWIFSCLECQS